MKIVVAADSFKECLSSVDVVNSIEKGIRKILPDSQIIKIPLADGGEGTLQTLAAAKGGFYKTTNVHNPLMKPIIAQYAIIGGDTAVIEIATACGINLVAANERNPLNTTTFGVGELIRHAVLQNIRNFIICIGGSATNDAGIGMLQSLGFRFVDAQNKNVGLGGKAMANVADIDFADVLPQLKNCKFTIACDVQNPFCGTNGAAYVFAPQKGASPQMVKTLDDGMKNVAKIIYCKLNIDVENIKGYGAAGGLGCAFAVFLNAKLVSGIDLILQTVNFANAIRGANLIITGEGKIDRQSLMGKVVSGVLREAQNQQISVVAVGGAVENEDEIIAAGIKKVIAVTPPKMPLTKALQPKIAANNIENVIADFFRENNIDNA